MGVTLAILAASGVLLGALAIVVDIGRIYVERGELQNGADSAALALARACADATPDCDSLSDLQSLARDYADRNAADGASAVTSVCGALPWGTVDCGVEPANLTGCLGSAPPSQYVEVHLRTEMADGSTVLPPAFAQTLAGGDAGTTVGACARATWGPADLTILAITADVCQFRAATRDGTHFADEDRPDARDEYVIQFWTGSGVACDTAHGQPWQDPRGAGFLDTANSVCETAMTSTGEVTGSFFGFQPYAIAPLTCVARVAQARPVSWPDHEVIYLPIHDARGGGNGSPTFRNLFVAPFVVTGYQLGAPASARPPYNAELYRQRSILTGRHPCDVPRYRCIAGVFVGEPIPISDLAAESRIRLVG